MIRWCAVVHLYIHYGLVLERQQYGSSSIHPTSSSLLIPPSFTCRVMNQEHESLRRMLTLTQKVNALMFDLVNLYTLVQNERACQEETARLKAVPAQPDRRASKQRANDAPKDATWAETATDLEDTDMDDMLAEFDKEIANHSDTSEDCMEARLKNSTTEGHPRECNQACMGHAWAQVGRHGTSWEKFFEFAPTSRVIRVSVAMTVKDTATTMAVYVRDIKAMFLVRNGRPARLEGNWRRMHIKSCNDGHTCLGKAIEASGVQRTHIVPYRKSVESLIAVALGGILKHDAEPANLMEHLNLVPLF